MHFVFTRKSVRESRGSAMYVCHGKKVNESVSDVVKDTAKMHTISSQNANNQSTTFHSPQVAGSESPNAPLRVPGSHQRRPISKTTTPVLGHKFIDLSEYELFILD